MTLYMISKAKLGTNVNMNCYYLVSQIKTVVQACVLTMSKEVAALKSGRKPTSRRCRRKL